jgi:hypothetical protein
MNVSGATNESAAALIALLSTNLTGEEALAVVNSDSCEALRNADKELQREEMLRAARDSAEQWAATTRSISVANCGLDVFLLCLLVVLRRHRPIQKQGFGFLACLLFGCFCGHIVSILDAYTPSAQLCRGRLAVIYLFIYGLLAPLIGKLSSLCRAAHNVLLVGHSTGWDQVARKTTAMIYFTQVIALAMYLSLTAGKQPRQVCRALGQVPRSTVCTQSRALPHSPPLARLLLIRIGCKRSVPMRSASTLSTLRTAFWQRPYSSQHSG